MTRISPKIAALLDKGLASHKAGDLDAAIAAYSAVLRKKPLQPDALWLKGTAFLSLGDPGSALECLQKAVKFRPQDAGILNDVGMTLEALRRGDEARDYFERALAIDSNIPSALANMARYELDDGDAISALEMAAKALAVQSGLVEAINVKALALWGLDRIEEAKDVFAMALVANPENPEVLFNNGALLKEVGQVKAARESLERCMRAAKVGSVNWCKARMTLGLLQKESGAIEAALEYFDSVLNECPSHVETLVCRGDANQSLGNLDLAVTDFSQALSVDQNCAQARFNLACINLLRREWSAGWKNFDVRWETERSSSTLRDKGIPFWSGTPDVGEKLLVWGEQGLGDQILFVNQISDLIDQKIPLAVEVDQRLVPLLRRSFPTLDVYAYDLIPKNVMPAFSAQVPMGSLGRFLRPDAASFPPPQPYLKSDRDQTSRFRHKYERLAAGRKIIGIAWHSVNPQNGAEKSLPLVQWEKVLTTENALFVSLQYGDVQDSVQEVMRLYNIDILVDESVRPIEDFDAAASQIAAMDLVVATSNTAVHLAGALGQDVWVMVPNIPDWRWGLSGKTVPWYQNVRVFRQPALGDWDAVLGQVAAELSAWVRND